ncbi:MAG: hypothetical protein R3C39_13000 [Dehalococcoidia bacterium]
MARTSVNIVVLAGSAATLAASMAGIARSEGYFDPPSKESTASIVAAVAAESVEATSATTQATGVQLSGLAPLQPLQLSPGRSLNVPQTQLDVQALTQMDASNVQPSSDGTPLTLSVQLPAPTVVSQPAQTVSQPDPVVSAPAPAPAAPAPAPAPALVAPPPPPPPAPAPAPATNTRAS